MNKFMGVDLIQSLEAVLHQNTGFLPLWQKSHTRMRKKILGNLYELDFGQHSKRVENKALPMDYVRLVYEHGSRKQPVTKTVSREGDLLFGKYLYSEYMTNESDAHRHILWEEKQNRDRFK